MKFILTVIFVIIVDNTHVLSTSSPTSLISSTSTTEVSSTETSSTTEMPTSSVSSTLTTEVLSTEASTENMNETATEMSSQESTTEMSSQESTTASGEISSSLSTTTTTNATDRATVSQTETTQPYTTTISQERSTTSESSLDPTTSTLHPPSTSFQITSTSDSLSSTETSSFETSPSMETSPQSPTAISVTTVGASVTSTVHVTMTAKLTTGLSNMTTKETTTEETKTDETTPEETTNESKPECNTTEEPTSTPDGTVPPTTSMTTSHPTTTPENNNNLDIVLTDNDVIPLSIKVTFKQCMKEKDALANLTGEILKLDTCKSVVIRESEDSCDNDTSTVINFRVHVVARYLLNENKMLTIDRILAAINNTGLVDTSEALNYISISACNSIRCQEAVLEKKGFNCENDGNICKLTSPCENNYCNNRGTCYIQTNSAHYLSLCKCTEDDMYTYSGSQCENKAYSWKLWTIVASGVGGGIIVILLFAVVIQCARKKSESFNQKYGYDSGFDDRENLMYDRRYVTSDEYHRKPIPRDDDGADQVNLQSFENKGYDHWEPAESKETYASMDRHFQDPTFHAQITRPKLTTNKYSGDQLTPF